MHGGRFGSRKAAQARLRGIISLPLPYITEKVNQATELILSIAGIIPSALPKDRAAQKFLALLPEADLDELRKIQTIFDNQTEGLALRMRRYGVSESERDQAASILSLAANIESAIGAKRGEPQQIEKSETVLSKS